MARYIGPKNRIARRFGANIFGYKRNPLLRKPNPPGQHGVQRRKKSDYGLQLTEKQKLKACYGMLMEKQLVKNYKAICHCGGEAARMFLARLECRLDNMVYRLGFANSIFAAQQLVSHGHVRVNGRKVDIRSFLVKVGMEISIKEKARKMRCVLEPLELKDVSQLPSYLSLDKAKFSGSLVSLPDQDQIESVLPVPINIASVCEFLAHHN